MDIEICCNTDDDTLFANVAVNSALALPWVKQEEAHDGHAVIVGGGPSLLETLDAIRWRQSLGQKVFALNNTVKTLRDNGIEPDYQVIIDARPQNIEFLAGVQYVLPASQCDPELIRKARGESNVILWHPAIEGIEDHIPQREADYALIGGGTTVGLSAMALCHTLGFRKLHLFGYDSSYRDHSSHAYAQPQNAGEPISKVTVFGKQFRASLTMAWQAELFPVLANKLIDAGCIITVDGDGLLPFIVRETARLSRMTEQEKYREMWKFREYRDVSPGEHAAQSFVDVSGIGADDHVLDIGCGTGRGAQRIVELTGCEATLLDFAENCLDENLANTLSPRFRFLPADITQPLPATSRYGYCADVLEHIPTADVPAVLQNIAQACQFAFFQISTVEDHCGGLIGLPLHLSVFPFDWWREQLRAAGFRLLWSQDDGIAALFYCSTQLLED